MVGKGLKAYSWIAVWMSQWMNRLYQCYLASRFHHSLASSLNPVPIGWAYTSSTACLLHCSGPGFLLHGSSSPLVIRLCFRYNSHTHTPSSFPGLSSFVQWWPLNKAERPRQWGYTYTYPIQLDIYMYHTHSCFHYANSFRSETWLKRYRYCSRYTTGTCSVHM